MLDEGEEEGRRRRDVGIRRMLVDGEGAAVALLLLLAAPHVTRGVIIMVAEEARIDAGEGELPPQRERREKKEERELLSSLCSESRRKK